MNFLLVPSDKLFLFEGGNMKKRSDIKKLALASILTATAVVVEFLTSLIPGMPQGGNFFGISMLFIFIIAYICGIGYGLVCGFLFGWFNFLTGLIGGFWWHWGSIFFDYLIPCTMLALVGLRKKGLYTWYEFMISILIVCFIRYCSHVFSGILFFSENANGKNVWLFSLGYNGWYMLSSTAICIVVGLLIRKRVVTLKEGFLQQSSNNPT